MKLCFAWRSQRGLKWVAYHEKPAEQGSNCSLSSIYHAQIAVLHIILLANEQLAHIIWEKTAVLSHYVAQQSLARTYFRGEIMCSITRLIATRSLCFMLRTIVWCCIMFGRLFGTLKMWSIKISDSKMQRLKNGSERMTGPNEWHNTSIGIIRETKMGSSLKCGILSTKWLINGVS